MANALNGFALSLRAIPPWRKSVAISPTKLRDCFVASLLAMTLVC
jgi:hypothetical protein